MHGSNGAPVANCFAIESLSPPSALTRGVALLGLLDRRLGQDTAPMSRRVEPCRALMAALRLDMSGISLNQVDIVAFEASIRNLFELRFLLSIKQGEPDWSLLPFDGLDQWPAIQWKLYNIRRMSPRSHKKALGRLRDTLEM